MMREQFTALVFDLDLKHEKVIVFSCFILLFILTGFGLQGPTIIIRLPLAIFLLLFIPGYMVLAIALPNAGDLAFVERIGLSFGISLTILPLLTLLIDILPFWALETKSLLIVSSINTIILSIVSWERRKRIDRDKRYILMVQIEGLLGIRRNRFSNLAVKVALILTGLVCTVGLLASVIFRSPASEFTEFYILNSESLAEDYSRQVNVGQSASITYAINNRESSSAEYIIRAYANDRLIVTSDRIRLESGEQTQRQLAFALQDIGENIQLRFDLYRDSELQPYRSLRIFISVIPNQ
jgi:uncharacterized membrane protein